MANGNLAPGRYKPSSLLTLHECPDLYPTRLKDRDFPSGASYINIREGYVRLQQCLTSKGNCKQYLKALRKMTSMVLLKHGNSNGIPVHVYVLKETVLKEMTAKIE
jgi:hypothetical protein